MLCTVKFVTVSFTAPFDRQEDEVLQWAEQQDIIKQLRSSLQRIEAWGETSCVHPNTSNVIEDANKIVALLDARPFAANGVFFVALSGSSVSQAAKTRLVAVDCQQALQQATDRLRDDAVQFRDAIAAIQRDAAPFAAVCQAGAWDWSWVVHVKRCGVAFGDVVVSAPIAALTPLTGGLVSATFRVDFGGNVGVRVFKANEATGKQDVVRAFLEPNALATLPRVLATARVEQAVYGKLPNNQRAHFPSLVGDTKLAIVKIGEVRFLGTAVTFFDGFQLVQITKKNPGSRIEQLLLNVDREDLNIRRLASALQSLDFVCGQVDRNLGNVMVRHDGQNSRVVGIDSDFSFSHKTTGLPTYAPPAFEKDFCTALHQVSQQELGAALKGLSVIDVNAAWQRLQSHQTAYAAAPPSAHVTIANASPGERTWAQTLESEFVAIPRVPVSDQHLVFRLYEAPRKAQSLNRAHSSITKVDGKACIAILDDKDVGLFLYSRDAHNNVGNDLPVQNRITLGGGGTRGTKQ
jgi:hypothetical protein